MEFCIFRSSSVSESAIAVLGREVTLHRVFSLAIDQRNHGMESPRK